jgi:cystine transport system substrate-binding protein
VAATQAGADLQGAIIRKGEPELLAAINNALAALKADGTYLRISEKYFGEDVSR